MTAKENHGLLGLHAWAFPTLNELKPAGRCAHTQAFYIETQGCFLSHSYPQNELGGKRQPSSQCIHRCNV